MGSTPLTTANRTIVSAFQTSLLHQLLLVVVLLAALAVAWNLLRSAQLRLARASGDASSIAPVLESPSSEPVARRVLRIGFGLIWLFDGILQAQAAMPVGLANQVLQPAASSSPRWVQDLVNVGVTIWNNHPITAAVAAVWVQVGIGIFLLVAPRGWWSRAAGIVGVGWGLVVWSFGEAFGGMFAPGATFLFGLPGAVLFYCVAGALIALPERVWSTRRTGRFLLGGLGAFLLGMALLQAWPGRGFWQGNIHGQPTGQIVSMVQSMASTPQPAITTNWVSAFGSFDAAHGFAVNLFVVVVLAAIGFGALSGRVLLVRVALIAGIVFFLADWVLVQDFGFFGGLGTDPNSMLPFSLLFLGGYLAFAHPSDPAEVATPAAAATTRREWFSRNPSYALRALAGIGATLVILLGVVPMAFASTNPRADPIVIEASDGPPAAVNEPAPPFALVDEQGHPVSLSALRGRVVALTFLDPVCTSDCPLIAQQFRLADEYLGGQASHVDFLAIVANPIYNAAIYTRAFDRQEGLAAVANWHYLSGSLIALTKVWNAYGVAVNVEPAGAMVDHSEIAYVIGPDGHIRYVESADPAAGSSTTESSFAELLDQQITGLLAS